MTTELTIAGLACFVLAAGHTMIGMRWVLPSLAGRLPATPLGPPAMTLAMLRFSWLVVTILQVGFGVLLMTLAFAPHANPKTLLLRWSAALWLAATAIACWNARRRPRSLLRPPVVLLLVVVAVMCGVAST